MSDMVSFYTALSGLQAAQAGLKVTADNVANAGTPGRTRQRVDLSTNHANNLAIGQIGSGVHIEGISRIRSEFLDLQVREGAGALGRLDARADTLFRLESTLLEPNVGIADGLAEVWAAFEDLANAPSDGGTREATIGALDSLVDRIRLAAAGVDTVADHTQAQLHGAVDEVNRIVGQLGDLNNEIFASTMHDTVPNDLLDRRDVLIDRLSELAAVQVSENDNGMMRVSTHGIALVEGTVSVSLAVAADGVTITTPGGFEIDPGGTLGGLQQTLREDIGAQRARLDEFAQHLADALNTTHAAGYTPSGASGGDLIGYDPSRAAVSLRSLISDRDDLAAAGDPSAQPFDGTNAQALGDLRFELAGAGGTMTLDDEYRQAVTMLAADAAAAISAADSQNSLVTSARGQRLNANGISVDEEMVNLMNYQRSYEAAARVLTVIDETMDLLVNRLGIVGR